MAPFGPSFHVAPISGRLLTLALSMLLVVARQAAHAQEVVIDQGRAEAVPGTQMNPWSVGNIVVGGFGVGTLDILAGGVVISTAPPSTPAGSIGRNFGSMGSVRLTGAGALWQNFLGEVQIGVSGQGTLVVSDGGQMNTATIFGVRLGFNARGVGEATVTDPNSNMRMPGELDVGFNGQGRLTIAAGGTVNNRGGRIAVNPGSIGDVLVTGPGSTWTNSEIRPDFVGLTIGVNGTAGSLTLADGGAAIARDVVIAQGVETTGVLNIGAAQGALPVAPGTLSAPTVAFGAGTGRIVFNHNNDSSTYSFAPLISGAGQVVALSGTTVLSGNNTYSGGTTLGGGVLQVASDAKLGAPSGALSFDTGTLRTTADFLTFRPSALGAGGGTFETQAGTTLTYRGLVTGNGALTKRGDGTLVLGEPNTYGGGTRINAGTLRIDSNANLGDAAGPLTMTDGGTLRTTSNIGMARNTTLGVGGGTLDTQNFVWTMNAPITGEGSLVKLGAGKLVLTANNTYTGLTNIAAGMLQLGDGGSTGAVLGDVLHNGSEMIFNRSNEMALAGAISGGGSLQQVGSGTTILSGNSVAFEGSTSVTNGMLRINGVLGNGTNTMTVSSGGRLGGTGTFGGNVLIGNGVLAPGNSPGMLVITGNLSLASASVLDYEFGEAGVVGGPRNDLTVVGGNLTLDGTLNLSASANGAFGPGLYRVISYGGTLTDNGLEIGTQPAGSGTSVQTAVARQVNLLNTAGLTLDFWDGDATPRHNGQIEGGPGAWQAAGGNDNWTDSTGVVNAPYAPGTFAVFSGTPGTVTIDNSLGAVISGGMQFATNGYVLQGQPLTLAPGTNILRVGDGSGPGADYVATIDAALAGAGGINKTDLGTLVLTGTNSYAGGTTISGGTMQIASDDNLGAPTGALGFDGGTLRTTDSFTTARATTLLSEGATFETQSGVLTHNGTLDGAGALIKTDTGSLILGADNSYTGGTTISGGILQLGNGGTTGSIVGDVNNNAALVFNRSNAVTFAGAISGSGTVTKLNGGLLTLTGASSYSGGTMLKGGQINVGHSTALGSGTLAMDEGTTLGFASDGLNLANAVVLTGTSDPVIDTGTFTETLSGVISGGGALTKNGSGTLVLAGANTYTGATDVSAGTMRAGAANAFSAASSHTVAAGATLDTGGFNQRVAALGNSGTASLISATGGSTLTVNGAYVGNAAVLRLGTGSSGSDRLVLDGATAAASGNTGVQIATLGGLGALTTGNGIEVISARNGATTTAQTTRSAFALAGGHVDAGAYEYRLHAADAQGAGENWYLRSTTDAVPPVIPPVGESGPPPGGGPPPRPPTSPPVQAPTYRVEVPLLAALPGQVRQADLAMLGNLHRRMGDEAPGSWGSPATQVTSSLAEAATRRAWGRFVYSDLGVEQPGVAHARADLRVSGLQAGTDLLVMKAWRAGVYVGYLDGKSDVSGNARGVTGGVGSNDLRSRFLGAYGTWMDASGWYFDSVLQGASHRYEIRPDGNPNVSGKASGFMASVEGGKAFAMTENWSIEPQAQLAWQHNSFDDVVLGGARVQQDSSRGWIGRLGVRIKGDLATSAGRLQPYGRLNFYQANLGGDAALFIGPAAATVIASEGSYSAGEIAAGATLALTQAASLYGEIGTLWNIGGDANVKSSVQGSLGIKVRW